MYKIETERGDLFDVNMMIAMHIKVYGKASETELTEAFRAAVQAFEILNCKVVIDQKGDAFYDNCGEPMNRIVFRDFKLEELIQEQERIRFRLEDGEFLRCFCHFLLYTFVTNEARKDSFDVFGSVSLFSSCILRYSHFSPLRLFINASMK